MSTLILYSSKYGTAQRFAQTVAENMKSSVTISDVEVFSGKLEDFETVVMGSCIYMGKIRKPMKKFMSANALNLKSKKIVLFAAGGVEKEHVSTIMKEIPSELTVLNPPVHYAGHVYDFNKMNFFERLVARALKIKKSEDHFREDNALKLAAELDGNPHE
ncbi:flavodoxin domain-containing protein [Myxococcota bacterium]|nr:flavodoxin domain-containing protein [Myxococcota bacterium]MBU1381185.1 flavodoxin domain-containing protein [Myxococcota bacterium]MBU1498779.1 flavodoxin domain-containing protein [Myxococcota bacterium]